ncbi:MAG: tyrosine--tRNA ligase [Ignavibacteria bacterium]|nr:tyrosine--tRNA ligase [Ignavibacteria bacterium]
MLTTQLVEQNFFKELAWRGFLHTSTVGAEKHLADAPLREKKVTGYVGFDPTAASLHVGSLLPIMGLVHLQRAGHTPIAIAGGGTGMIGDPSGKAQERKLLLKEDIEANLEGIKKQLMHFLDFNAKSNPAKLVNNADWLTKISMMEFLRDVGKFFSVNEMLAKDSVKSRLEQEQGMSFTEFSYSLLQSYDYLQLFEKYDCTLQMGGSDQWGNIVGGIDLIRRKHGKEVHGIVFPLITTSSGTKFGKTEAGTVWLDPQRTSPYRFYQYWINVGDKDVIKFLRLFTLLSQSEIESYHGDAMEGAMDWLPKSQETREAQRKLAEEVTRTVHGESALAQAVKASKIFFGGEITDVNENELLDIFSDVPSVEIPKDRLSGEGLPLIDAMVTAGVTKSKGEARRAIQQGGIYLNNVRISDEGKKVAIDDTIKGKFIVLRKGGRNYFLVRIK